MNAQETAAERAEAYNAIMEVLDTPAETLITSQDKPDNAWVGPRLSEPLHEDFRKVVEQFQIRTRAMMDRGDYPNALAEVRRLKPTLWERAARECAGARCLETDSMAQKIAALVLFLEEMKVLAPK